MSMLSGCGCLAGIVQMLRSLRQRLGQGCRCRDTLLANREAGEVYRLEEAARSVSEEELARILGNSFPGSGLRPAENCEDPEDLERLQEEFLEIVQSSDSQAALRAVESATSEIVNASDECVGSALHFIAAEGHVQACRALLARSDFGQVNSRNGIGSTALHIAAANDEEEICKMILACPRFTVGAAAVNNNGQTSMDFAAEFGTGLCLDILEASGCRYGTCRRRGRQVLTRRPANALGAQAEEVADMNESASHLLPDYVSPQSSYSGMLYSGLFAQQARCAQATQLGVLMSCVLVCRWRHRRKTRRGLGRHVARLPVAGKYDGPALDEYFGSDPFRALGRLVEVLSRINAARTAWQDSNLPVAVRGQHLRSQVASLGTVFVKLAQTMATRSDLVTKELGKELGLLQDAMGQFPNDVAMQTIREEFGWHGPVAASRSLEGAQLQNPGESAPLFSSLTEEPVAAASLAQVYRGTLTDGTEVAVKVQRPGLAELVGLDFYVLRRIFSTVNAVLGATRSSEIAQSVLDEVGDGLFAELDFVQEARHSELFQSLYGEKCPDVVVPEVVWSRTSTRVLTTTWLHGRKPRDLSAQQKLRLVNLAGPCLSLQLMDAGFVHCDPHEGNMMLLDDGRLGLIDFGLVAQMTAVHQESMACAILSLLAEDYQALVPCFRGMGILSSEREDDEDLKRPGEEQPFAAALEEALQGGQGDAKRLVQDGMGVDRRRAFGQLYEELSNLAFRYYFTLPSYYVLVMRSFVTLEGIAFAADPDFNMYTTSSPFALRRLLMPRTATGRKLLEETLVERQESGLRLRLWSLLQGRLVYGKRSSKEDPTGTVSKTVMEVLLAVPHGQALRRVLAALDSVILIEDLTAPATAPLRCVAAKVLFSGGTRSGRRRSPQRLLKRIMLKHLKRAAKTRPLLAAKFVSQLCFALALRALPWKRR
ncbi:unnamed protein product [Symbiodinium sp. CCMP2456]|nr:unnamed protein product [Symbiodinium sp. CCMP2456]